MAPNGFITLGNTARLHPANLPNSISFNYHSWARNPSFSRELKQQNLFFNSAVRFLEPCTASYAYWVFTPRIIASAKQHASHLLLSFWPRYNRQTGKSYWSETRINNYKHNLWLVTNLCTSLWLLQNHRITESQNSRGWKGPLWVI